MTAPMLPPALRSFFTCERCGGTFPWDESHPTHRPDCTMPATGFCDCDDPRCADCCVLCRTADPLTHRPPVHPARPVEQNG